MGAFLGSGGGLIGNGVTGGISGALASLFGGGNGLPSGFNSWQDYFNSPGFQSQFNTGTGTASDTTSTTPGVGGANNTSLITILGQILGIPGMGNVATGGAGGAGGTTNPTSTGGVNNILNALAPALKAGLSLAPFLGAAGANSQQNWLNAAKINVLNNLNGLGSQYQGNISSLQSGLIPGMNYETQGLLGNAMNTQANQSQGIQQGMGGLGNFTQAVNPYSTVPGSQDIINWLGGLQGAGQSAAQGLQGSLGQLQPGMQTASQLSTGSNPLQQLLAQTGSGLSQNLGNNATTQAAQGAGIQALQNFGQTPQLQQIQGLAQQMFGNPAGQYGVQRGEQLLSQNPLLPMNEVMSLAQNQSATGANNQYDALKRQLLQTTGITGPAIAGGGDNELLNQLGDQSMQNQSAAMTNAMLGQQGLQAGLFNTGAGLYNSSAGLGLTAQNNAINALLGGSGQALQNQTGLGGLALGGGNLALNNVLGGTSTLNSNLNSQLGGIGSLGSLYGAQTGGYNALNSLLNNMGNNTLGEGNFLQNIQGLGLQQNTAQYQALNNLLSQQGTLGGQQQSGGLGAAAFPANLLQQYLQQLGQGSTAQVGLFGQAPPTNYLNNLNGFNSNVTSPNNGGVV